MKYTDAASEYAYKVLSGDIIAGKHVVNACERHLSDRDSGHLRGLHFDEEAANRAIEFFPAMFTVTAGAKVGQPFHLLEYQRFIVGNLFGWYNGSRLRFRTAYIETGKGQAKSPFMGSIGLYMSGFMGEPRAQSYLFASKLDQAKIPFKDAVALCRAEIPDKGDTLEGLGVVQIRGAGENAWRIEFPKTSSFFEAKATTDSLSGPRPKFAGGDEVHEYATRKAIDLWEAGVDKMPGDALLMLCSNCPALDQQVGTDVADLAIKIADGSAVEDDTYFSYVARCDEEDDPLADESVWVKALPALGVTFDAENLRGKVKRAANDAATRLSLLRLYFGIPVGSSSHWVDEDAWLACIGEIDEDHVKDQPCYLALDLSEKNDLTALTTLWRDDDDFLTSRTHYWTTSQGLERRSREDRIDYRVYVEAGELFMHDSATIDYDFVAKQVQQQCIKYDVQCMAVDSAKLALFIAACERINFPVWIYAGEDKPTGEGLKIIRHAQGTRIAFDDRNLCMPHSIDRFTDKVLKGQILIERNRLTQYCAGNTVIKQDAFENKMFDKSRQKGRMDGMVTNAMAVGASRTVDNSTSIDDFLSSEIITG
ncbi:MAG: terminase TerL endonuclease subunit [Pseudomonadota bacterium]|nr:terminase TerL endonuclease subunit [Pseudomonadota bacterium]